VDLTLHYQLSRGFAEGGGEVYVVHLLLLVGVDGKDRGEQRDENINKDDKETRDRHPVLLEASPGILGEAVALQRLLELIDRSLCAALR